MLSIKDLAIRYPLKDEEKKKNRLAGEEILQRLLPEERESYLSYSNYGNQFHIGNQYLRFSPRHYDAWMTSESWDTETAVKLITIGYPLDLSNTDWIEGREVSRMFNKVYSKALSLAESAIARGKLKAIDTPLNWIAWAKGEGYSTRHLDPLGIIRSFEYVQSRIDYENCNESYRKEFEAYQEGIKGWQKIADIWGLTMAEPTPPQTEAVGDAGASSQTDTEPAGVKVAQDDAWKTAHSLSKLEKQQEAILKVIKDNKLNPMAIPDGKKTGVIQKDCENKHAIIFNGSTSFDRAWDSGIGKLWKMEYHESYARRGKY